MFKWIKRLFRRVPRCRECYWWDRVRGREAARYGSTEICGQGLLTTSCRRAREWDGHCGPEGKKFVAYRRLTHGQELEKPVNAHECNSCEHLDTAYPSGARICRHRLAAVIVSPHDGELPALAYAAPVTEARSPLGACGPDAALWQRHARPRRRPF